MYRRNQQNLMRVRVRLDRSLDVVTQLRHASNNTDHDLGTGFVRDNVWRTPARDSSYIKRACAENIIRWEVDPPDSFECVKELFDGRLAKLRIGRMSHAPVCRDLISQCAFRAKRELVPGGLSVDQKLTATRIARGNVRTCTVSLFADDEKQSEIALTRPKELFGGRDHSGNDAFGITSAT